MKTELAFVPTEELSEELLRRSECGVVVLTGIPTITLYAHAKASSPLELKGLLYSMAENSDQIIEYTEKG